MKTVAICDTQPVTAEGIRTLLSEMSGPAIPSGNRFAGSRPGILLRNPRPRCSCWKSLRDTIVLEWLSLRKRCAGTVDLTARRW